MSHSEGTNEDNRSDHMTEEGVCPSVEQCLSAKFHFVDLAGSERVGKTGNVGERFKGQLYIVSNQIVLSESTVARGIEHYYATFDSPEVISCAHVHILVTTSYKY